MPSDLFVKYAEPVAGTDMWFLDYGSGHISQTVAIVDGSGTQITSFGGGTQYAEGSTAATITGTAAMWEDTGDTLRPVSAAKPFPVDVKNASIAVTGTFYQATQPVSAASLPLPSGASTSSKQDTGNTSLSSIDSKITACNTGSVTIASSALPTGASTSANQTTQISSLTSIDGKLVTAITLDYDTGGGTQTMQMVGMALPASGGAVAGGTATNPIRTDPTGTTTQPVSISGTVSVTGTFWQATQPISAAALPLPSGASTESTLSSLNTKVTACDTGNVTIAGGTVAVTGTFWQSTQPVSIASVPSHDVTNAGTFATQDTTAMVSGSGSLTATNQAVTLTLTGHANATFQLSGTWVGTITFEASNNNSNWTDIYSFKAGDSVISSTATTNDIYRCVTAGFGFVRARCSAYTSGTITVTANACRETGGVFQNFPTPPGTAIIGKFVPSDGTNNLFDAAARPGFIKLTDGTNTMPTMDVVGRAGFVKVTDGTNTMPTMDATARSGFQTIFGDVAHGSADSGNPVKIGGKVLAQRSFQTATASAQRSNATFDQYGRMNVVAFPDDVKRLGVYYYHSGALTVAASADGAATAGGGHVWIGNPTGGSITVRVRRITCRSIGSALATPTSPRLTVEKFVFTGTASGTAVTGALRRTGDSAATGWCRTASTGMTISSAAVICSFFPVSCATAVGQAVPTDQIFEPGCEDYCDLAPGEGIVVRQADAGTTSDTRRYTIDFVVEEYTTTP